MMKKVAGVCITSCAIAATLMCASVASLAALKPFKIPPYLPVPKGAAVVLNSGSTNTAGFRIVIERDGHADYVSAAGRNSGRVTADQAQKFFSDLQAAGSLRALPTAPCAKSISFGTSTFVWWKLGGRSPDLSCPTNKAGAALAYDVSAIANALHLNAMSGTLRPLLPGEHHIALPSPTAQ